MSLVKLYIKLLTKNGRANSRLTEYRIKLLVFDLILDKPNIEKKKSVQIWECQCSIAR